MSDPASVLAECTGRGSVVAPAGHGKTHLIASAVAQAQRRQLVLTHTYTGVSVLRRRLREVGVPARAAQVDTIAGWCLRLCMAYGSVAGWNRGAAVDGDWDSLYIACAALLDNSFIHRILQASYGGMYVDEYQDCSQVQHEVVMRLATHLPCRVLGDPLQAIFDFDGEPILWHTAVQQAMPQLVRLTKPHRWLNAGAAPLGDWLGRARICLENREPIDLASASVPGLRFVRAGSSDADMSRAQADTCSRHQCGLGESVIAIHGGSPEYKAKCHGLAKRLGGRFSSIEEIEGRDLFGTVARLESAKRPSTKLRYLVNFAKQCMTNVDSNLSAATKRGSPAVMTQQTRNPAVALAANACLAEWSAANMAAFLTAVQHCKGVAVTRADLYQRFLEVCRRSVLLPTLSFSAAAEQWQAEFRHHGRPLRHRRQIGTTLLVKGLEFDHAIVLDAASLSRKHLYVALTRGAKSLTVISSSDVLNPIETE